MSRALQNIKVGDRVWIKGNYDPVLHTVTKLTPTQIIVENRNNNGVDRFQRGKPSRYGRLGHEATYYQIGYHGFDLPEIKRIATEAECETWDAEQEQKRLDAEAAAAKRKRQDELKEQLNALFGKRKVSISNSYHQDDVQWQATLYLTEDGVRRLAMLIEQLSPEQLPSWKQEGK